MCVNYLSAGLLDFFLAKLYINVYKINLRNVFVYCGVKFL